MFVVMGDDIRRGSEHVRIKGTTEELGEIIPPPVHADAGVEVPRDDDDVPEGAERVHIEEEDEEVKR
jgi:hypothetical protein